MQQSSHPVPASSANTLCSSWKGCVSILFYLQHGLWGGSSSPVTAVSRAHSWKKASFQKCKRLKKRSVCVTFSILYLNKNLLRLKDSQQTLLHITAFDPDLACIQKPRSHLTQYFTCCSVIRIRHSCILQLVSECFLFLMEFYITCMPWTEYRNSYICIFCSFSAWHNEIT